MAIVKGVDGIVKNGTVTIAYINNWSASFENITGEVTAFGDTGTKHEYVGVVGTSGSNGRGWSRGPWLVHFGSDYFVSTKEH